MRLIDADALKNLAEEVACCGLIDLDVLKIMIDNAPTVDAVPVVRCKDCMCWVELENGTGICKRLDNVLFWFGTDADDFCSFGERKDDDTD